MSDTTSRLLIEDARKALVRRLVSVCGQHDLIKAYVGWILGDKTKEFVDFEAAALASKLRISEPGRTYRDVAVLGFAEHLSPHPDTLYDLRKGLCWMLGRRPFLPNREPDFEVDGIALLGMAVGILASGEWEKRKELEKWFMALLSETLRRSRFELWDRSLIYAAQLLITNESSTERGITPDLALALAAKGFISVKEDYELKALDLIINQPNYVEQQVDVVATRLAALNWLMRQVPTVLPNRATPEDVVNLLQRVPDSLRRWCWEEKPRVRKAEAVPVKWQILNEYHVQDLLWVILAPIFPDLEDEENLRSLGHKHPRYDLGIPSLRLIIEVKFIYNGTPSEFSRIIEEVASDASLYLSNDSGYDKIIVFVWDSSCRIEQHGELRQGLKKLQGVIEAIVIPKPGKMRA